MCIGKAITESYFSLSKVCGQIEAMLSLLDSMVYGELAPRLSGNKIIRSNGLYEGRDYTDWSHGAWIRRVYGQSYDLYQPKKQNPFSNIAFDVRLAPSRDGFPNQKEPIVSVVYAGSEDSVGKDYKWNWGIDDTSTMSLFANGYLQSWDVDLDNYSWKEHAWAFSVPLVSLNSQEDLRTAIIDPIAFILRDEFEEAFPKNTKALKFSIREDGHGFDLSD